MTASVSARAARSAADVFLRRTRLGVLDARGLCAPGADGPELVARALGAELGWDEARVRAELDAWRQTVAAEGLVPLEPSEPTAAAREAAGRASGEAA